MMMVLMLLMMMMMIIIISDPIDYASLTYIPVIMLLIEFEKSVDTFQMTQH